MRQVAGVRSSLTVGAVAFLRADLWGLEMRSNTRRVVCGIITISDRLDPTMFSLEQARGCL